MAATTDSTGPARDRAALAGAAASVGAADVFVFRRITAERFVHVGGLGRGESWAGNVDLILAEDAHAREAVASGSVATVTSAEPVQIFGPYYERTAVLVPVSGDVLVVFGGVDPGKPDAKAVAAFEAAAQQAAAAVAQISPAKRLADELELLHAVQSLAQTSAVRIDEVMRHVARSSIAALSCDLGVIYVADVNAVEMAEGEPSETDPGLFLPAMRQLYAGADSLPACVQDSTNDPPRPRSTGSGLPRITCCPSASRPSACSF